MLTALRALGGHAALGAVHALRRLLPAIDRQDELRVINLHGTPTRGWPHLDQLIEQLKAFGGLASARDLSRGGRFLLSFDDGYDNNFAYAEKLASRGVQCLYFVVPSFLGRTAAEYLEYHRRRGVDAFVPVDNLGSECGLSLDQARALHSMGHVVGAHNFAHRSLGTGGAKTIAYEVDEAITTLSEVLHCSVEDFALAFGYRRDVSSAALAHLILKRLRVYTALRGSSTRGGSRLIHRTGVDPMMPLSTCIESALGTLDWLTTRERGAIEAEWRALGGDA